MPDAPAPRHRRWRGGAALLLAICTAGVTPGMAAPKAAQDAIAKAQQALTKRDGIAAEVALRDALDRGAAEEEVAPWMGEALLLQNERRKAREWLDGVAFAKGTEAHGFRMLALLERADGDLAAAGAAYDKALKFAPKDSQLWVDIGRLRYAGGEQLQANAASEFAVRLNERNPRALEFRAQLIRDQYGFAAALPWLERALQESPDDLNLLGEYAATLGEMGRLKDMLTVTRRMIELSPNNGHAWYLQAVMAARAGKYELARNLVNRLGDRWKQVPAAQLLVGTLELQAGNANLAVEIFDRLLRRQPANLRAQLLLARAMYDANQYQPLFERFDAMAARPDAPVFLLTLLGRAHEEQGDRAKAAALLDRAAKVNVIPITALFQSNLPGTGGIAAQLRTLIAAGNLGAAEQLAERNRSANPGSGDAMALAGDVQLALGRGGAALDRYARAAQVRNSDSLMLRMAMALDRQGRGGEAPAFAANYLNAYPTSRLAARMVANYAAISGNWQLSRTMLENLRDRGGQRDARLLADLSLAQLRTGDAPAAAGTALQAYQLQRASAMSTQAYGMALADTDQQARAQRLLAKAKQLGGDNPLLREVRGKASATPPSAAPGTAPGTAPVKASGKAPAR